MRGKSRLPLLGYALALLTAVCPVRQASAQVFVCYRHAGIVNEYDIDTGALIKEGLISGLQEPRALCLDNGCLYILEQASGTVSKYDALTGTPLNTHFISSFNQPQAMTVSDGLIFVASFEWPFQRNGYDDPGNLIGKYDAATGACLNATFLKTNELAGSLFAHHHKLIVPGRLGPNGAAMFDTATGAALPHNRYTNFLYSSAGLAAQDDWLWITPGQQVPLSFIFKYNIETGQSAVNGGGPITPFIVHVPNPGLIAVSGDDLLISTGPPGNTRLSKYNAVTGALIKDDFIADHGDQFAGLAAIPRASTPTLTLDTSVLSIRNLVGCFFFWAYLNGDTLYLIAVMLFFLVILGVMTFLYYHPLGATPEPSPDQPSVETVPESVAAAPTEVTATELPAEPARPQAQPISTRAVFGSILAFAALVAGGLTWLATGSVDINQRHLDYPPDLIGIWGNDTTDRDLGSNPVFCEAAVFPDHIQLSGSFPVTRLDGKWHDDGFWCPKPDGSGEVEVCKLTDPLNLECHLDAFQPGNDQVKTLYKLHGSADEMKALAAKYPGPITYPPPDGVIAFWMPEFELKNLPWKCDHIILPDDEAYSQSVIYVFRSDISNVQPLLVTVKNHRVVKVIHGDPNAPY